MPLVAFHAQFSNLDRSHPLFAAVRLAHGKDTCTCEVNVNILHVTPE